MTAQFIDYDTPYCFEKDGFILSGIQERINKFESIDRLMVIDPVILGRLKV